MSDSTTTTTTTKSRSRSKSSLGSKLGTASIVLGIYLVHKYQDTPGMKRAMKFLFNPGPEHALPQPWQDARVWVLVGVLLLLVFVYRRTLRMYREAAHTFGESEEVQSKPPLSVVHAGYYFQQESSRCLLAWIIDMCDRGALSLHYAKGAYPWAIRRDAGAGVNEIEQQRIDGLFSDGDPVLVKPWMSNPNPVLRSLANDIYTETQHETGDLIKKRQSSVFAVLALIAFFAEIPFYTASLSGDNPGVIAIAAFGIVLTALPAFAFTFVFSMLFNESKMIARIIMAVACVFAALGTGIVFYGSRFSDVYFGAVLLPGLAASLAVLVRRQPVLPKDELLLSQVVGFRNHLAMDGYRITEEDLPWTLAMSVRSGLNAKGFFYRPHEFPRWLHTDETDVQEVMKLMHQTLSESLGEAVTGRASSNTHHSSIGHHSHRF